MADTMRDARLPDMHVGIGMRPFWWILFPDDLRQVLEQLPACRVAEDLGHSRPRDWRTLADLTRLVGRSDDQFFPQIIDLLDPAALLSAVGSQTIGNEYELRCLLWVLTRGRPERRRLLACHLYPLVLSACQRSKSEQTSLLRAFKELDSNLGERVLAETGLNPASLVQDERKEDTSEGEKAFQQFRKEVAAFEATNRDYIIDLTNWRLVELEEN